MFKVLSTMQKRKKGYGLNQFDGKKSIPKKVRSKAAYDRLAGYLLDKFIKDYDPNHEPVEYDFLRIHGKVYSFRIPKDISQN